MNAADLYLLEGCNIFCKRTKLKPGLEILLLTVFLVISLSLTVGMVGCSSPDMHADRVSSQQTADNAGEIDDPGMARGQMQANPLTADGQANSNQPPKAETIKLIPAVVTKVVDGDTLHLQIKGHKEKVRLIGVDTPELSHPGLGIEEQPYGREAAAYAQGLLDGRQVYLELDIGERDRYGRLLAYVWLEQPTNDRETEVRAKMYNADLLINGYAEIMTVPPNVKYVDLFTKLQKEARKANKGLWGITSAVATPEPALDKGSGAGKYIGNSNSKKFHNQNCRWAQKISPQNRIEFGSRGEAVDAGYQPCKTCQP